MAYTQGYCLVIKTVHALPFGYQYNGCLVVDAQHNHCLVVGMVLANGVYNTNGVFGRHNTMAVLQ